MKVKLAKTAGFCFGVRRAVDTVYRELKRCGGERIYTYGPIIHNEEVIKDIQARGATVLRTEEELDALTGGTVIIRSHGVEKRIYDKLEAKNISIVDATCPYVKKIHNIVREESEKGNFVIIIGDPNHPEVKGIRGWAGENAVIIQNAEEIEVIKPIIEQINKIVEQEEKIYLEGTKKSFDLPEFKSMEVAKNFINLLDTKELMLDMLNSGVAKDINVYIGDENDNENLKDFSIVTFKHTVGDKDLGTIGIIGPKRMDYSKVISVMKYISNKLNRNEKDEN